MTQKIGVGILRPFQLNTSILINLLYFKIPAGDKSILNSNWLTCNSWPTSLLVAVSCKLENDISLLNFSDKAPTIITFKFQILSLFLPYFVILSSFLHFYDTHHCLNMRLVVCGVIMIRR